MNILFITETFPEKDSYRGVFIKETALAVASSHKVAVIQGSGIQGQQDKFKFVFNLEDNLQILRFTYREIPFISFFPRRVKGTVMAFEKLLSHGFKPDIINACVYKTGVPSNIIKKKYGIPYVIREGNSGYMRKTLNRFEVKRARVAMENAAFILPVSAAQEQAIRSYGIKGRFEVVRNVVPDYFCYAPELRNSSKVKKFLCVADMHPKKNIPNLINACNILRKHSNNFAVDIVGEGKKIEDYRTLTRQKSLEDTVTFLGKKPKAEIARMMQRADFFVLPSRYEPSGNVLVEALSCGLPVVATRVGGIPEVINESNGILVESDNSQALADNMELMMDNCDAYDRKRISEDAHRKYSYDAIGKQLTAIYGKVLKEREKR